MIDYNAVMQGSSPTGPSRKCPYAPDDNGDDSGTESPFNDEPTEDVGGPASLVSMINPVLLSKNQNLAQFVRCCATKKKLKHEQVIEVDSFVSVSL